MAVGIVSGAWWTGVRHLWAEYRPLSMAMLVYWGLMLAGLLWSDDRTWGLRVVGHQWFWLAVPVRRALEALRALPEVVWGLILVTIVGVGPVAGIWALGLHSAGALGRLFSESFENVPPAPVDAIVSTGASRFAVATYGTLPLALGPLAVHGLFRLEWNTRQATVVGMIGAGGVGQALYEAQQLFFYQRMMAYLLITWLIVLIVDHLSQRTRMRLGGRRLSPEEILH